MLDMRDIKSISPCYCHCHGPVGKQLLLCGYNIVGNNNVLASVEDIAVLFIESVNCCMMEIFSQASLFLFLKLYLSST